VAVQVIKHWPSFTETMIGKKFLLLTLPETKR